MPTKGTDVPSDDAAPPLPPTGWAVLGLLSFGEELSGYDLKRWADWSLKFFYWSPSFSQIYGELRRLEKLGLASSRIENRDDVRGKRMYQITDAGQSALRDWAADDHVDPVVLKHGVMLRLWLGHLSDPDRLRRVLAEHRDQSERMRVRAEADREGATAEPGWAFPELVLRWSERYYADERDRAELMLAELDEASRTWSTSSAAEARRTSAELRQHRG
ncbi:helix-turn-helix transcriptional regulator [Nocardioides kongjuensis]|uniref:DNA-binding PadR family transcriptional regulator n=1 Tax=Nocardioides kongjuensis TaxID=349522 RepID=A0A852RW19_9ACTN|nr:DNA-binding PadR family transcriptional regulator [Nocardioides kongjuensis]